MSRSLSYLRRGLLGIAFIGSLGFGATQAFGSAPIQSSRAVCNGDPGSDTWCWWNCAFQGENGGYCDELGRCVCGM